MRPAIRSDSPILYLYYNKNFLICQGKETADGRLSEIIGLDGCGPPKIATSPKITTTTKITTYYLLLSTCYSKNRYSHYYKNHYCRYYSKSKSCYYQYAQKSLQEFLLLLYNYYLLMLLLYFYYYHYYFYYPYLYFYFYYLHLLLPAFI